MVKTEIMIGGAIALLIAIYVMKKGVGGAAQAAASAGVDAAAGAVAGTAIFSMTTKGPETLSRPV